MLQTITIAALCVNLEHICRIFFSNPDSIVLNSGMAFSLLQDMPMLSSALSYVALATILAVFFLADLNGGERLGYSMILGGALSNCAEKFFLGYVIDWIPLPLIPLTINIADVEISLGVLIAFLSFER